jgi:translation initiation factor IF-1
MWPTCLDENRIFTAKSEHKMRLHHFLFRRGDVIVLFFTPSMIYVLYENRIFTAKSEHKMRLHHFLFRRGDVIVLFFTPSMIYVCVKVDWIDRRHTMASENEMSCSPFPFLQYIGDVIVVIFTPPVKVDWIALMTFVISRRNYIRYSYLLLIYVQVHRNVLTGRIVRPDINFG